MKVYIISTKEGIKSDCFTSMAAISRSTGIHKNTLQKHFRSGTKYVSNKGVTITVCELIRIKGRGRKHVIS